MDGGKCPRDYHQHKCDVCQEDYSCERSYTEGRCPGCKDMLRRLGSDEQQLFEFLLKRIQALEARR